MAIHEHVEVRIFSGGQPLQEYDDPEAIKLSQNTSNGGDVVCTCVESKPGASFELEFKLNSHFNFDTGDCLSFMISIDGGGEFGAALILKEDWQRNSSYVYIDDGLVEQTEDRTTVQKYRFNKIDIDESTPKVNGHSVDNLGSIRVAVYRKKDEGLLEDQVGTDASAMTSTYQISEKSLKGRATDTVTRFDGEIDCDRCAYHSTSSVSDTPLAEFVFRYLSHDGLLKSGIIQTPEPTDPFEVLQSMSLDKDQIDRLYDIASDARQALRVKRENDGSMRASASKRSQTEYDPDELEEIEPLTQPRRVRDSDTINID